MLPHMPQNLLVRAAFSAKRPKLASQLQHISFEAGHQFWPPDMPIPFALFPLRGIVTLQLSGVHVALVGREGFAGVPLLFGLDDAAMVPLSLTRGEAVMMPPDTFRAYLRHAAFRTATERYTHLLITMLAQMTLCARIHGIEENWVGRLLLIQDRTETDSFQITQGFFSRVLGVRRASLNLVATTLRNAGAIEYDHQGWLTIRNRRMLEDRACTCYHAMKARFDRLMHP